MSLPHILNFASFYQGVKVIIKHKSIYPIALKFGTLEGRIRVHPDTKFGYKTINGHKVINGYLQKNNTNMLSRLQSKLLMARN